MSEKILNPATGRYVSKFGKIGKNIQRQRDHNIVDVDVEPFKKTTDDRFDRKFSLGYLFKLAQDPALDVCPPTTTKTKYTPLGKWVEVDDTPNDYTNFIRIDLDTGDIFCYGCVDQRDCKQRFSYFILSIGLDGNHANAVLVDHGCKMYERFEPHGSYSFRYDFERVDKIIEEIMSIIYPEYVYYQPSMFCPIIGPQSKQKSFGWTGGYCLAYSVWYNQLRLLNPHLLPEQIVAYMNSYSPQELQTRIRKYCTYIEQKLFGYGII